jgi:hypothetical protein
MALDVQGVDYLKLPVGTTAQRPTIPASGMIRQNSTTGNPEWWDATSSQWRQFNQPAGYAINYLVVGGGGGGGNPNGAGGGGGAGGFLTSTVDLVVGTAYTITIGAGAASASNGTNSLLGTLVTALGGGGGGSYTAGNGFGGGSGGGGGGGNGGGPFDDRPFAVEAVAVNFHLVLIHFSLSLSLSFIISLDFIYFICLIFN